MARPRSSNTAPVHGAGGTPDPAIDRLTGVPTALADERPALDP